MHAPVPWKDDPAPALLLDGQFVCARELFMRFANRVVSGTVGAAPLDLLPKEDVVEIHDSLRFLAARLIVRREVNGRLVNSSSFDAW